MKLLNKVLETSYFIKRNEGRCERICDECPIKFFLYYHKILSPPYNRLYRCQFIEDRLSSAEMYIAFYRNFGLNGIFEKLAQEVIKNSHKLIENKGYCTSNFSCRICPYYFLKSNKDIIPIRYKNSIYTLDTHCSKDTTLYWAIEFIKIFEDNKIEKRLRNKLEII